MVTSTASTSPIQDLRLALEVDGTRHLGRTRKDWDVARDRALQDKGWATLRFSTRELEARPQVVLKALQDAGVRARARR